MTWPDYRVQIPDTTPVVKRVAWLDAIADEGTRSDAIERLVRSLAPSCAADGPLLMGPRQGPFPTCAEQYASAILAVVQRVPYFLDPPGEWFQSSRYTLAHGGDCEDKATLLVSMARVVGIPARVRWMDESGEYNHVTAEVYVGGRWQWAETIVPGALLGEEPHAAVARLGAHPGLVFHG